MNSYMDFTSPNAQFTYDLRNNVLMKKDDANYILELSIRQLNTLGQTSLLDIFLSKSNIVEPHIHQNASELVYCISGEAVVSLINPFTKKLMNFPIRPGQVANVPQGWWHYEIATTDQTQLLAIFDAPVPQFVNGSDILRLTPAEILSHAYCLNEAQVKEALAPIKGTVIIGPPASCGAANEKPNAMPRQSEAANEGRASHPYQTQSVSSSHNRYAPYYVPYAAAYPYAIPASPYRYRTTGTY